MARLVPPHRTRHRGTRLPHPGAAEPESPAAGLTLPRAVLLLQPLFKCWTGRSAPASKRSNSPPYHFTSTPNTSDKTTKVLLRLTPESPASPTLDWPSFQPAQPAYFSTGLDTRLLGANAKPLLPDEPHQLIVEYQFLPRRIRRPFDRRLGGTGGYAKLMNAGTFSRCSRTPESMRSVSRSRQELTAYRAA